MKPAIVNYKPRAFLSFYQTIFYISDVNTASKWIEEAVFHFSKTMHVPLGSIHEKALLFCPCLILDTF
jgi:hypothetical protein